MALPKIGNLAPAFTLLDQDGNKVSLKQFRDNSNVVLYFYPKAMTPGCTVQACGIRDSKKALAKLDTVVLGVSPDPVARLGRFIEKQELPYDLLGDPENQLIEALGAWGEKSMYGKTYMGVMRSTFLFDEGGKLTHVIEKVKSKEHGEQILALVAESVG